MELLTDVTYPQPLAELLEGAYTSYARGHPWLLDHHLAPKSVVRDMWERAMTFGEYVSYYGLVRTEGAVLRYLSDAYRALRGGIPAVRSHRGASRRSSTGSANWCTRSTPACSRSGRRSPTRTADVTVGRPVAPSDPRAVGERPRPADDGAQRDVPSGRPVRARRIVDLELLDRGIDWQAALDDYFDEYDLHGHRPRRPRPGTVAHRNRARPVGGPAGVRRPRGRPRLGHRRRGGPRRHRRGGRAGAARDRGRAGDRRRSGRTLTAGCGRTTSADLEHVQHRGDLHQPAHLPADPGEHEPTPSRSPASWIATSAVSPAESVKVSAGQV